MKCALVGWEEGGAGQISTWLKYKIVAFVHTSNIFPTVNKKLIKKKYSKFFNYPEKGKYLKKKMICSKNWALLLKKSKIKNVLITVSDNKKRLSLIKEALSAGLKVINAIHPSSIILSKSFIGTGVIIEPLCYIGSKVEIGNGVWIKAKSSIDHNSMIKDGVCVGPSVQTGGNCYVGKFSSINIGSSISNKIRIGSCSIVGMGSNVLKNIPNNVYAWGNPAKIQKKY